MGSLAPALSRARTSACAAAILCSLAAAPAHADHLGVEFGMGPILLSRGTLHADTDPFIVGRVVAIYHAPRWAAETGIVIMSRLAGTPGESSSTDLGMTAGVRVYESIASGARTDGINTVRWRFAGYVAGGWTRLAMESKSRSPTSWAGTATASIPRATPVSLVADGPRVGLGVELLLSSPRSFVASRINLESTYQVLRAAEPLADTSGGYASLQLLFATSVGR